MLKETETEETSLFCDIFSVVSILIGSGEPPAPLATSMAPVYDTLKSEVKLVCSTPQI